MNIKAFFLQAMETYEQRLEDYGPPDVFFHRLTVCLNALFADKLKEPLDKTDVALVLIQLKTLRGAVQRKAPDDTFVDLANYAYIALENRKKQ